MARTIRCTSSTTSTFFLNDPVNGDEFVQVADRVGAGRARADQGDFELAGFKVETRLGSDIHYDLIDRSALQNDGRPRADLDDRGTTRAR